MALSASDLHKVGGGNKQLFLYESADAVATIAGSGYFNDVTNQLNQDDVIIAVGSTGGTRTVDVLVVTSASGAATVTTTNGT
jgi:DNA-binding MurR/RpiR family transcriptional regulator